MVIEEPAPPPKPEEVAPQPTPPPRPARRRRVLRTEPPPAAVETTPEAIAPPPAEVPALEPGKSSAEESTVRQQIRGLQEDIRQRLARLPETRLSPSDRKTLADARTFFTQSGRALEEGDLQRALNLARKASLLVAALEQTE